MTSEGTYLPSIPGSDSSSQWGSETRQPLPRFRQPFLSVPLEERSTLEAPWPVPRPIPAESELSICCYPQKGKQQPLRASSLSFIQPTFTECRHLSSLPGQRGCFCAPRGCPTPAQTAGVFSPGKYVLTWHSRPGGPNPSLPFGQAEASSHSQDEMLHRASRWDETQSLPLPLRARCQPPMPTAMGSAHVSRRHGLRLSFLKGLRQGRGEPPV